MAAVMLVVVGDDGGVGMRKCENAFEIPTEKKKRKREKKNPISLLFYCSTNVGQPALPPRRQWETS